jgi:hypothetical protein
LYVSIFEELSTRKNLKNVEIRSNVENEISSDNCFVKLFEVLVQNNKNSIKRVIINLPYDHNDSQMLDYARRIISSFKIYENIESLGVDFSGEVAYYEVFPKSINPITH